MRKLKEVLISIALVAILFFGTKIIKSIRTHHLIRTLHDLAGEHIPEDIHILRGDLCKRGYATTIGSVSASMKRAVFREHQIPEEEHKNYTIDRFVDVKLGGSNERENLRPQPKHEAKQKDTVETFLHEQMCRGIISIPEAQILGSSKWREVYDRIR